MTTQKPPSEKACYGILCEKHAQCQRYHAIDGAPAHQQRIGTCDRDGNGERPLFLVKVPS